MPILPFAIKAINKGVQIHKNIKAAQAKGQKLINSAATKPKPKPAPRVVVKKPVAVIPAPKNPPVKPAPKNTYRVLGMDVPKPLAWVGGTALGLGAIYGISKLANR